MVNFGFYQKFTEINDLLKPLLYLLNGIRDISKVNEERAYINKQGYSKLQRLPPRLIKRYEETEENIIIHRCKETACQIIKLILDIQEDTKVTLFLDEFKKATQGYFFKFFLIY